MNSLILAFTNVDPTAAIMATALIAFCIGFFGAALMASRTIDQVNRSRFQDGYAACNRDHARRRESQL